MKKVFKKTRDFVKKSNNSNNNKISSSEFLKDVNEYINYFFKALEIRTIKEIDFPKDSNPLIKYMLYESQFIKHLFTMHLMHYIYHPIEDKERKQKIKSDKDFFISFFNSLKEKDGELSKDLKKFMHIVIIENKKIFNQYSKILSEEIDVFINLMNKNTIKKIKTYKK